MKETAAGEQVPDAPGRPLGRGRDADAHVGPEPYCARVRRDRLSNPNLLPVEAQRINRLLERA